MEQNWVELSPDEKREVRFKRWLSPSGVKFTSPEAQKTYQARVTRLISAIKLKEPDRVPVMLPPGFSPAPCGGITLQKAMYDYDELCRVWLKFLHDFETDTYSGPDLVFPAKIFDDIGFKSFKWPGHGLSPDSPTYQYVEGEYMKADEYDMLIEDPSDFWMRTYMPRIAGAFEPLQRLSQYNPLVGIPVGHLIPYGMPDIQAAFQVLLDAGREGVKWVQAVEHCNQTMLGMGIPRFWSGIAMAPFDGIADMVRGTQGAILDMYRQPDKLLEALEIVTPRSIESAVTAADFAECPMVFIPLHKGADNFMSSPQYKRFYWPTFRRLLLGIINEGCVPIMVADGSYNDRLEIIKDLPRASVIWIFEQTDMAKAKAILGDTACIGGNVTAAQLYTYTPQEIKEYCKWLIEVCGKGGGYILTLGSSVDRCNPENLQAVIEAAKEYGVYN